MSAATETTQQFTNPSGYPECEADQIQPVGTWVLLRWEESKDEIRAGKFKLVRPETHKKQHYTGVVHAVGGYVDPQLEVGQRVFFEQFSGFQKMFDPKYGRVALVKEESILVILPPRVKVESSDGDYDYGQ